MQKFKVLKYSLCILALKLGDNPNNSKSLGSKEIIKISEINIATRKTHYSLLKI